VRTETLMHLPLLSVLVNPAASSDVKLTTAAWIVKWNASRGPL